MSHAARRLRRTSSRPTFVPPVIERDRPQERIQPLGTLYPMRPLEPVSLAKTAPVVHLSPSSPALACHLLMPYAPSPSGRLVGLEWEFAGVSESDLNRAVQGCGSTRSWHVVEDGSIPVTSNRWNEYDECECCARTGGSCDCSCDCYENWDKEEDRRFERWERQNPEPESDDDTFLIAIEEDEAETETYDEEAYEEAHSAWKQERAEFLDEMDWEGCDCCPSDYCSCECECVTELAGGEVVSPPGKSPAFFEMAKKVFDRCRYAGGRPQLGDNSDRNHCTGYHVHVDARDLTKSQCILAVIVFEELLRDEDFTGLFPQVLADHRLEYSTWAKRFDRVDRCSSLSLETIWGEFMPTQDNVTTSSGYDKNRYKALNLRALLKHNTLEFRIGMLPDSSTEMIRWALMCRQIIDFCASVGADKVHMGTTVRQVREAFLWAPEEAGADKEAGGLPARAQDSLREVLRGLLACA